MRRTFIRYQEAGQRVLEARAAMVRTLTGEYQNSDRIELLRKQVNELNSAFKALVKAAEKVTFGDPAK